MCLCVAKISAEAYRDIHLPSGILRSSETARNLGVTIDQLMTFDAHARACSRSCFSQLRRIRQIRRFIDDRSLRLLVHAFVTSRLDYCNGLLANCSVSVRQRSNESRTVLRVWSAPNQLLAMPHHCCVGYTGCRLPDA